MGRTSLKLTYQDLHTAGEPVRIVTGGYPDLAGASILEKRRTAKETHDHLRRAMMWEPRGHEGMYGVIPVAASHKDAAFGVLFTHHEGYSTMCGHATIALGRWAVETERVPVSEPVTRFAIEAPCGLLRISTDVRNGNVGAVRFESVPAFVLKRDLVVEVEGYGTIVSDIAYGGAFYAILPAASFGLDFFRTPVSKLVDAAAALTERIRASVPIRHPDEPDLGFLYGTIITDGANMGSPSHNLCVFADRQIDRSPTGSGVTARMALDHAKGLIEAGQMRTFMGISGEPFTGQILTKTDLGGQDAVRVEIGGRAHWMGEGTFIVASDDPLGHGFALAKRFADIAKR